MNGIMMNAEQFGKLNIPSITIAVIRRIPDFISDLNYNVIAYNRFKEGVNEDKKNISQFLPLIYVKYRDDKPWAFMVCPWNASQDEMISINGVDTIKLKTYGIKFTNISKFISTLISLTEKYSAIDSFSNWISSMINQEDFINLMDLAASEFFIENNDDYIRSVATSNKEIGECLTLASYCDNRCFQSTVKGYARNELLESLKSGVTLCSRDNKDGSLIGFASILAINERRYHLPTIVIDEKYRGEGYGTDLIRRILRSNRKSYIECFLELDDPRVRFFSKVGCKVIPCDSIDFGFLNFKANTRIVRIVLLDKNL